MLSLIKNESESEGWIGGGIHLEPVEPLRYTSKTLSLSLWTRRSSLVNISKLHKTSRTSSSY